MLGQKLPGGVLQPIELLPSVTGGVDLLHQASAPELTSAWVMAHTCAVVTVVEGDFEWDSDKAASNLIKHDVSFSEAATVFADPFAVYLDDGTDTGRMTVIGTSLRERVLFVVHVERGERDRIISARRATPRERELYESGDQR